MQNHSFNISTQESLSDSRKPVRAALRYSYQSEIVILLYTTLPVPARLFRRQIRPNFCREFWQYCTNTSVNKRYKHVSVCNTFSQECGVLKDIKKSLLLSTVFRSETAQSGAKPRNLSKYRLKWNAIFFHIIFARKGLQKAFICSKLWSKVIRVFPLFQI